MSCDATKSEEVWEAKSGIHTTQGPQTNGRRRKNTEHFFGMLFHLDCCAAKSKLLIELSILERIDRVVDYSPEYTTQVERNADWPDNSRCKSCITNHDA